jgi:6-phosphogluconolactonase
MKFNKVGQVSLVSAIALILASTFTACSPVTIDYLFVAGNKQSPGQIQTFLIDRVSGALNPVNGTVSSGGVTPVSMAVSTDYQNLYVANQGDSTLVQLSISSSGVLKSAATINMDSEGNTPVAIYMNPTGTLLYVINMYQPGCTAKNTAANAATCNGGALAVYPVGTSGTLGSAVANGGLSYWPVGINPTAVNALTGGTAVYVSTYDPVAGLGYLYGFSPSTAGALSTIAGSPFNAGVKPVGITSTPTNRYVYVTDFAQNELIAFGVLDGGALHPLINGPFKTGNQPSAITIDPRGIFIYVSNQLDNTVSAYEIATQTGTPSAAVNTTGASVNSTQTEPVAVLVDSAFGRYVYTANFLDNSISGFKLNSSTGTLSQSQSTPYPTVGQPAALASVPHGNHSINVVQP